MTATDGVILCLAYILGLLSAMVSWRLFGVSVGGLVLLVLGVSLAIARPLVWRTGPKRWLWLTAGIVGLMATFYFQARSPQPAINDVSRFVQPANGKAQEQQAIVSGKVDSKPRLTRSQKAQFWLEAVNLKEIVASETSPPDSANDSQVVSGKLYVTVPLLQATGVYPGQNVAVTGVLYEPKPPANPGGFDFKAYLAKEGAFAGLRGVQVSWLDAEPSAKWGWWTVQRRIVRSQVNWLGVPEGPMVSAIALGKLAVDIPYDIKDQFVKVGLAHALAASGAQVSIMLGLVLALTKHLSNRMQFILGTLAIFIIVGLTGGEAPILRASVMGVGALVALVMERKVNPLGSLLFSATILLLLDPLWIGDLGFQLSFLATLGLLVTSPGIMAMLDWMPPAIASFIATPLAASVWVLPLQIYFFGVVSAYCIAVNIITAPLIAVISIGGTIGALAAVVWPLAGSALSWPLLIPVQMILRTVQFFCELPGNSVAVGTISTLQMLALYGLIGLVWFNKWLQRRWWLAGLVAVCLVVIPVWQTKTNLFRITVLATSGEPVLAIEDKGQVTLINSGDDNAVRFTVLPFLQKQGVNQIDWAIATKNQLDRRSGWTQILQQLPVKMFYGQASLGDGIASTVQARQGSYQSLPVGQGVSVGSTSIQLLNPEPLVMQFQIRDQNWLLLGNLNPTEQQNLLTKGTLQPIQVLWWSGDHLNAGLLAALKPKVAIASSQSVDPDTAERLNKVQTQLYWTGRDGALQWTPTGGFETMLEATENKASFL